MMMMAFGQGTLCECVFRVSSACLPRVFRMSSCHGTVLFLVRTHASGPSSSVATVAVAAVVDDCLAAAGTAATAAAAAAAAVLLLLLMLPLLLSLLPLWGGLVCNEKHIQNLKK